MLAADVALAAVFEYALDTGRSPFAVLRGDPGRLIDARLAATVWGAG